MLWFVSNIMFSPIIGDFKDIDNHLIFALTTCNGPAVIRPGHIFTSHRFVGPARVRINYITEY